MLITKWLKKYETKNYRFVTFEDNSQYLIVDDGDALSPIDVQTGEEISCFGHHYVVDLAKCYTIKETKISLIKAKRIAMKNDLYVKYKGFVEKVKEVETQTGEKFKSI